MNIHENVRHQMAELRWSTKCDVYPVANMKNGALLALVVPPRGKFNDTANPFDFEDGFVARMKALAARGEECTGPDWRASSAPHLMIFAPAGARLEMPRDAG